MKLNTVERLAMNNPLRAAHQHHREARWFRDLLPEGGLKGMEVLEVGCGRGVGVEVLLDRLGASHVSASDLDPEQVERAQRRLHGRPRASYTLSAADAVALETRDASVDAVISFGTIHHVPRWADAVAEVARVLRPGGRFLFEEVPRHVLDTRTFRTLTDHPREDRFEAPEFAEELARHGLHGTGRMRPRVGGMVFVGSAVRRAS